MQGLQEGKREQKEEEVLGFAFATVVHSDPLYVLAECRNEGDATASFSAVDD